MGLGVVDGRNSFLMEASSKALNLASILACRWLHRKRVGWLDGSVALPKFARDKRGTIFLLLFALYFIICSASLPTLLRSSFAFTGLS